MEGLSKASSSSRSHWWKFAVSKDFYEVISTFSEPIITARTEALPFSQYFFFPTVFLHHSFFAISSKVSKSDDQAILPTQNVNDECAQRNTDVDFKRVADQCSQHDTYIAVSKLLAVRVSDSSADWVAVLRSFPAKDRSRPLLVAIGIGLWRYEPGTPDGKTWDLIFVKLIVLLCLMFDYVHICVCTRRRPHRFRHCSESSGTSSDAIA